MAHEKEIGKPYSPWMQFRRFSIIPNWLLHQPQITPGAKLCFARLLQYCGKNDYCFPRVETLAAELGVSERQVARYISELKENKLISVKRKGLGHPNHYFLLWHAWADEEQKQSLLAAGGLDPGRSQDV